MAENHDSHAPDEGQILRAELRGQVKNHVRREVGSLSENIETLRGLASALDLFAGVSFVADSGVLRETATGIHAIAAQVLACANETNSIAIQLSAWAGVSELAGQIDE